MLRQINFEKENPSKVQFSLKNDTTKIKKSGKTKYVQKERTKNENCKSDISSDEVMSNENENEKENDNDDEEEDEDEEQAASRLFISSLLVHGNYQLSSSSQHPMLSCNSL